MTDFPPISYDALAGHNLRRLRIAEGMTQQTLGGRLGVTFQQIQKYEKGVNRLSAGRLFVCSKIFRVPLDEFFAPRVDLTLQASTPAAAVGAHLA